MSSLIKMKYNTDFCRNCYWVIVRYDDLNDLRGLNSKLLDSLTISRQLIIHSRRDKIYTNGKRTEAFSGAGLPFLRIRCPEVQSTSGLDIPRV